MLSFLWWYCGPHFHLLMQKERPGIEKLKVVHVLVHVCKCLELNYQVQSSKE